MVACWLFMRQAALSHFSVNITLMFLCGKMGWESATQAQGMLVRGCPWNSWPTTMVLIRCAPLRETVITVLLGWLWKAVRIWRSVSWPSGQRTMPSCILSTCSWVGRMNRMRSRNAAYLGSTILNCWCKRWMTALEEEKVALLLIMEVVEVMRPLTVCKGCCWHLSPARTTTGRRFIRLSVKAITPKIGGEIIDASSATIRSYWLLRWLISFRRGPSMGMLKAPWRVSVVTSS